MVAQVSERHEAGPLQIPRAVDHLLRAGLAGVATLEPDGTVRSREGVLSSWLPAVGHSCFESPILSGLDDDLRALRSDDPDLGPLVLPGVRLATFKSSPRCHILITWHAEANEHAVLTTVDQLDRPIDHWVLQQKREQRLLEEKLIIASRDLARVNENLRDFTSVAAHDLQAPLRQISSFAGFLRRCLGPETPKLAFECIDTVEQCAARLTKMIAGLLEQARLSSERFPFEPVDLHKVVSDASRNLAVDIEEAEAKIVVRDLPTIMGSATLLTNLFQNLIANSLRYRSADRAPQIEVRMGSGYGRRYIAVSDNGIGIPSQYAKTIFSSFVRVSHSTSNGGVGLGLSLCRRITDIHGWSIHVDPAYADGACFCIDIGAEAHA